ncbi:DUF2147 domain-containing protein [Candidatus Methylacidithermus pantelleriae]|nr:DUF2147 domain-containing protein [Candidatus Methylacidithermus pantelleriae]
MIWPLWVILLCFPAFLGELHAGRAEEMRANSLSVTGRWIEFDEATGKPHIIIRILCQQGEYRGIIERPIQILPDDDPKGLCRCCKGALHNQPIIGMTILWGMKKSGPGEWSGGHVLDPRNGTIYQASLRLQENGNKLLVRGYVLSPLFGRSEVWERVNP